MRIFSEKNNRNIPTEYERKEDQNKRMLVMLIILCCFVFLYVGRLFMLQVVKTEKYSTLSDNNQIRIVSQTARRGDIFDKNMLELATSEPVFAISVSTSEVKGEEREILAKNLAKVLNDPELPEEVILDKIKKHSRAYEPLVIARYDYYKYTDILMTIEENRSYLPGVIITEEPRRCYPFNELAGHLIGTVGLINEDEKEMAKEEGYLLSDWLGKSGVEKTMERFTNEDGEEVGLRGERGLKKVEVNSKHQPVDLREDIPAIPGNSVVLTIDAGLQSVMEDALKREIEEAKRENKKAGAGAAVLIDIKTGGILASASYPTINPNDFSQGMSHDEADYYFQSKEKPTMNRVISAAYPPGSTFKPITATAAMVSGIDPEFTVNCTPANWPAPRARCFNHGVVNLEKALAVSCNTYFQEVAYRIGIEKFFHIADELGLGKKTGINLGGEVSGVLPSPEWKKTQYPEDHWEYTWRNYDTFYMAMGQGANLDTPIQMANAIATIANDGVRMTPYVVDRVINEERETVYQFQPEVAGTVEEGKPADFQAVRKGMKAVVSPGGTAAYIFRDVPYELGGKTGTAQTGLPGDDKHNDYHGWFVAFAPYENPEVAFAGVIEYGHNGGPSAGMVCRDVLNEYFNVRKEGEKSRLEILQDEKDNLLGGETVSNVGEEK